MRLNLKRLLLRWQARSPPKRRNFRGCVVVVASVGEANDELAAEWGDHRNDEHVRFRLEILKLKSWYDILEQDRPSAFAALVPDPPRPVPRESEGGHGRDALPVCGLHAIFGHEQSKV